ncbi:putative endoplasmic reticulum membrane protein [Porphyridium purpureum]|uniref:Putative endoplasmic reticulum membrane protein n=1 Tax=Porphyridium purpureum TaxID=35688 RepID=A0A5J4YJT3_PORPP|nr:putative endoplasmic reticulum membrane protein [Porphyridium purpureum]|eukprot:POR1554..scf297_16
MAPSVMDLPASWAFYRKYHRNAVNVRIHLVCVPIIVLTFLSMLAWGLEWTGFVQVGHGVRYSGAVAVAYAVFCALLDKRAGVAALPYMLFLWQMSRTLMRFVAPPVRAVQVAVLLHAFAWVAQFIGHGAFEGSRPALVDNLVQSFLTAPLFVLLEICFKMRMFPQLERQLFLSRMTAAPESTPGGASAQ